MALDAIFANLATGFAAQFGAPFHDAQAVWPGVPTYDAGGSITIPATPITKACKAQVDDPTTDMRADADFMATDMRLIVLAASLDGALDPAAKVVVSDGPHAGTWAIRSVKGDPAGIGYECRARKIA